MASNELPLSLASTGPERSIASTACTGSSCVDSDGEDREDNLLSFLHLRFGFGSALVLLLAVSELSSASFRL